MPIKLDLSLHVVFMVVKELSLTFEHLKIMFRQCTRVPTIQLALHEAVVDTFSNEDTEISSLPDCADFNEVETSDKSEEEFQTTEDPPTSQDHVAIQCSSELLQKSSALFLLGLKENYKLSQVAVQGVLEGVTNLSQQQLNLLHSKVYVYIQLLWCIHVMYVVIGNRSSE